jgi:hypothetical protein
MKLFKSLALSIAMLAMAGCMRTASASYLMTIEVDDNGKIYSGSGVWKQIYEGSAPRGFGDAIAVDIGTKGTLFVLVRTRSNGPDEVFYGNDLFGNGDRARALRGQGYLGLSRYEQLTDIMSRVGQTGFVDCYNLGKLASCPRMVAFMDISDPQSVVDVDPTNLSAVFGSGVSLRPIRVTVSRDRVTKSDNCKKLPWLNQFNDLQLDGKDYKDGNVRDRGIKGQLRAGSFSFEGCKQ